MQKATYDGTPMTQGPGLELALFDVRALAYEGLWYLGC